MKYVKIKRKNINGLRNPEVVVEGYYLFPEKENDIQVYGDNKLLKSNIRRIGTGSKIIIKTKINNTIKKIKIYLLIDNKKELIVSMNNTLFTRLISRARLINKKLFKPIKKIGHGIAFLWREHHFLIPPALWGKYLKVFCVKVKHLFVKDTYYPFNVKQYNKWIKKHETKSEYKELEYQPLISILIPVYNIERYYLSECLDSILNQTYQNFEVCLADDCSTKKETIETLEEYKKKDKRIKVVYRKENGHISKTTNSALEIATGEFIGLMDDDDVLTDNCLYEMVLALNENKELDFIYSDEDKLDMKGRRCEPHFKPDYSPDSILGGNYFCHFEIIRASIIEKIGGFRTEFVGAQDFDLFLRVIDETTPDKIKHIPKILYHWRKIPGSTADTVESKEYAIEAGRNAVEETMKRRKIDAEVTVPIESTHYIVNYKYKKEPKISIIIPTRDLADILDRCLNSIYEKTKYDNYEVIVVDNDSKEEYTKEIFKKYSTHKNFKVIEYKKEFNYASINNYAVKKSTGDYILFLNNDTEVITPDWLEKMVGYAMQKHIACVGVKLLYPNDDIQHGGVVLGIDGIARHAFLNYERETVGFYGRMVIPYNYSAVTAACLMIERKKFDEVNGFTEELRVAYNDIDLNLKLRKKGYYNVFLPQVELYHYESKSRGLDTTTEKYKQYLKEKEYMLNHWKEELENDPFYNPNLSKKDCFMLDK